MAKVCGGPDPRCKSETADEKFNGPAEEVTHAWLSRLEFGFNTLIHFFSSSTGFLLVCSSCIALEKLPYSHMQKKTKIQLD